MTRCVTGYYTVFITFCLCIMTLSLPEALADSSGALYSLTPDNNRADDAISSILCSIVKKFTQGPLGKGISTIAIIVLGIGFFLGKLSWGLALATAIGIGMIFGSEQMVSWIAGAGSGEKVIVKLICS